jgi:hypothetical protein
MRLYQHKTTTLRWTALGLGLLLGCSTPAAPAQPTSVDVSDGGGGGDTDTNVAALDVGSAADSVAADASDAATDVADTAVGDVKIDGADTSDTSDVAELNDVAEADAADTSVNADADADAEADTSVDADADANGNDATVDSVVSVCESALTSIAEMPLTSDKVDFELCSTCGCCLAGGSYPLDMTFDCLECTVTAALADVGGKLQGGNLTTMVSCVLGNAAAPMNNRALFVGSGVTTSTGGAGLIVDFAQPVTMFGFSAVSTASNAVPNVTLRGYDDQNALVAQDSFAFTSAPGGQCATLNPAVQFFGFRPCFGAAMTRVEVDVSDGNVAIDEIRVYRP